MNQQKIANMTGLVFQPVGAGLMAAVQPWPEYGESTTPVWPVKVLAAGRLSTLAWSARLGRWSRSHAFNALRRDLPPEALRDLENHIRDTLEGALC